MWDGISLLQAKPSVLRLRKCKTAWLEEMVEEKQSMAAWASHRSYTQMPAQDSPIDPLDLYLARFTQFLIPVAPFALDFSPHSRTSGMLRVPGEVGLAESVSEEDIAKGLVDDHVDYLRRRRLCMFLMVDGSGGELPGQRLGVASRAEVVALSQRWRSNHSECPRESNGGLPPRPDELCLQA